MKGVASPNATFFAWLASFGAGILVISFINNASVGLPENKTFERKCAGRGGVSSIFQQALVHPEEPRVVCMDGTVWTMHTGHEP